jgi:hypothetical protein
VRAAVIAALTLAAAACAPTYPVVGPVTPGQAQAQSKTPAQPSGPSEPSIRPPAAPPMRSPIPPTLVQARDPCGAVELQRLVGHLRTEIPVPVDPRRQRVACTSCPVTEDFDPARLNFLFDAQTGRIRQIRCG